MVLVGMLYVANEVSNAMSLRQCYAKTPEEFQAMAWRAADSVRADMGATAIERWPIEAHYISDSDRARATFRFKADGPVRQEVSVFITPECHTLVSWVASLPASH